MLRLKKKLKALNMVVITFVVLVICILFYIQNQPSEIKIQGSTFIHSAVADVHKQLTDFRKLQSWISLEKHTPKPQSKVGIPWIGAGASYQWLGDDQIGSGQLEEVTSSHPESLEYELTTVKPFASKLKIEILLSNKGPFTHVTWMAQGSVSFLGKLVGLFKDYAKYYHQEFEKSFANLRDLTEKTNPPIMGKSNPYYRPNLRSNRPPHQ